MQRFVQNEVRLRRCGEHWKDRSRTFVRRTPESNRRVSVGSESLLAWMLIYIKYIDIEIKFNQNETRVNKEPAHAYPGDVRCGHVQLASKPPERLQVTNAWRHWPPFFFPLSLGGLMASMFLLFCNIFATLHLSKSTIMSIIVQNNEHYSPSALAGLVVHRSGSADML